jgi:hypothetical protein
MTNLLLRWSNLKRESVLSRQQQQQQQQQTTHYPAHGKINHSTPPVSVWELTKPDVVLSLDP